jgi:hypothetical protein
VALRLARLDALVRQLKAQIGRLQAEVSDLRGMRCKDYFQAQKCFVPHLLSSYPE